MSARLFLLLMLAAHAQLPMASTVTAALGVTEGSLFDAFTNEFITEILVNNKNYELDKASWAPYNDSNPYRLTRNLLIRSPIEPVGQLDFQFLSSKVLIASGVTVTLEKLVLRNVRRFGGFTLDFFVGEANSTVILQDVVRAKLVCNPIDASLQSARSFRQLPNFPPNNVSTLDGMCVVSPSWEGQTCYTDSLHFQDFAFLVQHADPDSGNSWPGYVLYMHNTTRVCDYYISAACIAASGGDTCIAQMLDAIVNGTRGFMWTPGAIAGVAVAASVVLIVVALCCYYRIHVVRWLVRLGHKSLQELESQSSPSGNDDDGATRILLPSSGRDSGKSVPQTVRLGVLLGSGSFGRVYRGRWHGTDVAVKIISCTPDELPKVLKEAELMMQLHHPNIVRAYQCSVWNPADQAAMQAAKPGGAGAPHRQPRQPRGSAASGSQPTSSTALHTSSTARGSSSTGTGPPVLKDSVVVNIMPDIVLRQRPGAPTAARASGRLNVAQAAAADGSVGAGSGTVSSSQEGTSGPSAGSGAGAASASVAAAAAATSTSAASGSTSSSEAARRLFSKVLHPVAQHQQQQQAQWLQQQQGPLEPSTRSWSHEGYPTRLVTTPLSSAAPTVVGSSTSSRPAMAMAIHDPGSVCSSGGMSQMRLAPVLTSQAVHSAPLPELQAAGAVHWPFAGPVASTLPAGLTSSQAPPVLLPMVRSIAAGTGAAVSSAAAAAAATSAGLSSSQFSPHSSGPAAVAEGKDGSGWAGGFWWQQQQQQHGGSLGSKPQTDTTSSSGLDPTIAAAGIAVRGSGSQHVQQQGSSAEQLTPGAAAAAAAAAGGSGVGEIQPASAGLWRWRRGSSAGSTSSKDHTSGAAKSTSGGAQPQRVSGPYVPEPTQTEQGDDASTEEGRKEVQVWLVLELCTGGTLKDAVSLGQLRPDGKLEMAKLLCRLLDAANGMSYLHSKGVLHGDLKAGNVLLQSSVHGTYGQVAKISDFGLAATLMAGATHRSTASVGTITHMAPEVLRSGHMSLAADVYSFGVMMWEVYTNDQAHGGLHYGAVVERVVVRGERPPVPPDMPKEYELLMQRCWHGDAARRPSFDQIVAAMEILLDNLTSDSEGRISEGSEENRSIGSGSSSSKLQELLDQPKKPAAAATAAASIGVSTPSIRGRLGLAADQGSSSQHHTSGAEGTSSGAAAGSHGLSGAASGSVYGTQSGSHSGPSTSAAALGMGVTVQDLDLPAFQKHRQQQQQPGASAARVVRAPSGPSSSSAATAVWGGSRTGQPGWSGSLGSGSWGSGTPVTPQQLGQQLQRQRLTRMQLQETAGSTNTQGELDGSHMVQDL